MGFFENLETDIRRLYARITAIENSRAKFMDEKWENLLERVQDLEARAREEAREWTAAACEEDRRMEGVEASGEPELDGKGFTTCAFHCWEHVLRCKACGYVSQRESPAEPEPRNSVVLEVLRDQEWAGGADANFCPDCSEWENNGHYKDCRMAAAIREAGG